jgi:hypothetical protein
MIHVSDHALLRVLERVHGLDIDALRTTLAAELERARQAAAQIQSPNYRVVMGEFVYCIKNETLVTVLRRPGLPLNVPQEPQP